MGRKSESLWESLGLSLWESEEKSKLLTYYSPFCFGLEVKREIQPNLRRGEKPCVFKEN
jgi:hypothetical protein